MLSLRAALTAGGAAVLIALAAACAPPSDGSTITPPPDPAAAFVAALPVCPDTITVMQEGTLPTCRPVDHTSDGSGLPSQRIDLMMVLDSPNAPLFGPETAACQGNTPATGYGGQPSGFNLATMRLTCRQINPALAWWRVIDPASVAA